MTHSDTRGERANRLGSECPPWCTADHGRLLVEEPPVYLDYHMSDYMNGGGDPFGGRVYATASPWPGDAPDLRVILTAAGGRVSVTPDHAEDLAEILGRLAQLDAAQIRKLAAEVRAAAATAREAA